MDAVEHPELDFPRQGYLQRSLEGPLDIVWYKQTDSTNDQVKLLLQLHGSKSDVLCVANRQTQGHGTHQRVWENEKEALLMSVGVKAPIDFSGIALAIGVGIHDVISEMGVEIRLKWPNDLWTAQGKVGGILCEMVTSTDAKWLVVGVGINLLSFGNQHAAIGMRIAKEALCAQIVRKIRQVTWDFSRDTMRAIAKRWHEVDFIGTQTVRFETPEGLVYTGLSAGIDTSGRFLLQDDKGLHRFMSGHVSWLKESDGDSVG